MKPYKYISTIIAVCLCLMFTACDEEKELIVISGKLPIKTSTLYIVGDATPAVWDINNPVELTKSESDHLVFVYDGLLVPGEMKAYLDKGNFDGPCIHPLTANAPITDAAIENETFRLYSKGEDLKWKVGKSGHYRLTFDLRNWTFSSVYLPE